MKYSVFNLYFPSSHAPAWEFIQQRSRVAGRWNVTGGIPTPERGNEQINCFYQIQRKQDMARSFSSEVISGA